jgi:hypothetical protein
MKVARPKPEQFQHMWDFFNWLDEVVDEDAIDPEEVARRYQSIDYCWRRVLLAGQTCIETMCDPEATTLELKPEPVNHTQDSVSNG